ncbi:hypothetical protein BDW_13055 [Bdellovibrio bacteriovorus W]|nr:hypothetical protein BDW_13055 [Bdellovibrio bacteriovorus W]
MGDDSSRSIVKALKNEWSLLWDALQRDKHDEDDSEEDNNLELVKAETKALLQDRKKINEKLESLNKEIELNAAKLESLILVGADSEPTLNRLNELSDVGQTLATLMQKVDSRLRDAREKEDKLQQALLSL